MPGTAWIHYVFDFNFLVYIQKLFTIVNCSLIPHPFMQPVVKKGLGYISKVDTVIF